ncbi:acyltransferase [uncultured Algimonas sp.]|uniref:acyltransferase family protein n=1 Tax=uncultured Algimonas sp. TaxID=1547920 RepID=UPI0026279693|nr:acyltransferase [uncultured Algimonas sp.]
MKTKGVAVRDGHDNFFTPLRLVFALMVMVGHAFVITRGGVDHEPQMLFHYTPSYLAVNLFFIASGFLVTGSMFFRNDGPAFAAARLLRIYPALIVHVAFILFLLGPVATSWPVGDYLLDPGLWLQPFKVLSFANTDLILPGVFEGNGEPYASHPLWTLRFEMICYVATGAAFALGLMRRRWMVLAQFALPAMVWMAGQSFGLFDGLPATAESLTRFGMAYGLGATLFAYRDRLRYRWAALPVLFVLAWGLRDTALVEVAVNLFLATAVMLLAYMRLPRLAALQRWPDLSYGAYIYHWGVMQLLIQWWPGLDVAALFVLALPVVLALSWLSWTMVEKPMLAQKGDLGRWLRFGRGVPRTRSALMLN